MAEPSQGWRLPEGVGGKKVREHVARNGPIR